MPLRPVPVARAVGLEQRGALDLLNHVACLGETERREAIGSLSASTYTPPNPNITVGPRHGSFTAPTITSVPFAISCTSVRHSARGRDA